MENAPVWMYPDRDASPPDGSDDENIIVCDACGRDIASGETYYNFDGLFINVDTVCRDCIDDFLQRFKEDSEAVNE